MHDDVLKALEERIDNRTYDSGLDATLPSCDLSGIIIGGRVKISRKELPGVNLHDAIFLGDVIFFTCTFKGLFSIINSNFYRTCMFDGTTFEDAIDITSTTWHGYCSFSRVKFESFTVFIDATFKNRCSFRGSTWRDEVNINPCTFEKDVFFSKATFEKNVDFSTSRFGSGADSIISFDGIKTQNGCTINFYAIKVNGIFSLKNATLRGYAFFDGTHFPYQVFFSEADLGESSFRNCTFDVKPLFDRTNLERTHLLGAQVELFNLMACVWPTSNGRCITVDSRKVDGKGYFEITSDYSLPPHETVPPIRQLEDLYRRLKKTAQDEKDDQRASDFHYAEKELQRLLALQIAKKPESACDHHISACNVHGRIHYAFEAAILWIYKLVSEYGEGPGRALLILLILALLPLMFIGIGDTVPSLNFEAFRLAAPGILNKWVYFSPMVKIPGPSEAGAGLRILLVFYHIAITLQAALFGFALRNRFKR